MGKESGVPLRWLAMVLLRRIYPEYSRKLRKLHSRLYTLLGDL